jgi:hypothetical protein
MMQRFMIPASLSACFISETTWPIQIDFKQGLYKNDYRYSWQRTGYNKIV